MKMRVYYRNYEVDLLYDLDAHQWIASCNYDDVIESARGSSVDTAVELLAIKIKEKL